MQFEKSKPIRFEKVLVFDKSVGNVFISSENLLKMRSVSIDDISHLGKVIRYYSLYKRDIINYSIPFTGLNILINKEDDKIVIGTYTTSNLDIGLLALIPCCLTISIIGFIVIVFGTIGLLCMIIPIHFLINYISIKAYCVLFFLMYFFYKRKS